MIRPTGETRRPLLTLARRGTAAGLMALGLGLGAVLPAQADNLADIRSELSQLAAQIEGLKSELTSNGASLQAAGGASALDRMNSMESELSRLTSQTEQLQNKINRVVSDGTNRIGDLEFRICDMEEGCDVSNLPTTKELGAAAGGAAASGGSGSGGNTRPAAAPNRSGDSGGSTQPELAVAEKADYDRAKKSLDAKSYKDAADQFASFITTYPGSPLAPDAHYYRGQALEQLGDNTGAANAYLKGFDVAKTGELAPQNLLGLGRELGKLGQVSDACVTLNEVGSRFPTSPAAADARSTMTKLSCQ